MDPSDPGGVAGLRLGLVNASAFRTNYVVLSQQSDFINALQVRRREMEGGKGRGSARGAAGATRAPQVGTLHCLHPSRSGSRDSSPRLRVPELSPCAPSLQAMRDFASDLGSTLGLDVYAYSGAENSAASLPGPPSSALRPAAA